LRAGAVKTNIGHLELAAGVAGVIKVLLQLKHQTLVRSLHCDEVNPYIELGGSPFYLLQENRPWLPFVDQNGRVLPRRAGISSFGFGGVNAHLVLEEYLAPAATQPARAEAGGPHLVVLSAKNELRLAEAVKNLDRFLSRHPDTELSDLAYTLQTGREAMEERLAFVVDSLGQLKTRFKKLIENPQAKRDFIVDE